MKNKHETFLKEMEGDKEMLREMESALLFDINNAVAKAIKDGSNQEPTGMLKRLDDIQSKLKAMGEEVHPYDENAQAEGDLSKVDDETLAAELTSRGWTCEREPDGGYHPDI